MKIYLHALLLCTLLTLAEKAPAKMRHSMLGAAQTRHQVVNCSASDTAPGSNCMKVYDDNFGTVWYRQGNTGWIEIDFGRVHSISKVVLDVDQSPNGTTNHTIYYGNSPAPATVLQNFNQYTSAGQKLIWAGAAIQARYIRVTTTASPSWLSWAEIQAFP